MAVHYSLPASRDLHDHAEFLCDADPFAAERWLESHDATCALLGKHPKMGEVIAIRGHGECRRFVSGNYVILYREASDGIEILRILRGGREIDRI
ncbi:MAG: type II toxin-antitoxin system RelE/ParE family toxin [Pirellulales bacterium]